MGFKNKQKLLQLYRWWPNTDCMAFPDSACGGIICLPDPILIYRPRVPANLLSSLERSRFKRARRMTAAPGDPDQMHMQLCWVHRDHSLAWTVLHSDCSCLVSTDSQGYFLARSRAERHWRRNKYLFISLIVTGILLKARNRNYSPATSPYTNAQKSQFHHVLLPLDVVR